jgi:hypothetical protein
VNVYFVVLCLLGLETFVIVDGHVRFTYIALSHSVSSIVVTGAMVATVVFSYAYSSSTSGDQALLWSWTGYSAAASHLIFVVLHNAHDIPIDFYLPTVGQHVPGSRMIGFGFEWYRQFESVFLGACVALFVLRHGAGRWGVFGATVWLLSQAVAREYITVVTRSQYLLVLVATCVFVPLWARLIEGPK